MARALGIRLLHIGNHIVKVIDESGPTLVVMPSDFVAGVIAHALTGVQPIDQEGRVVLGQYAVAVPLSVINAAHVRALRKFLRRFA